MEIRHGIALIRHQSHAFLRRLPDETMASLYREGLRLTESRDIWVYL